MARLPKYAAIAALLLLLPWAALAEGTAEEREEPSGFLFRFRSPAAPQVAGGSPHGSSGDHGHDHLSADEFARRQEDVRQFWEEHKSSGGSLDQDVVIELFRRAKHFSVVHALLVDTISPQDSVRIGQIRAEIHQQVLTNLYESGRFGDRLGVNDFGTVGNAKSDIDFTPYAERQLGADLVEAYEAEFRRLTGGVSPGQMDIVAHKHEAFIPDWRQSRATADFVQALREGRRLLRSNPEAYFLEGAYHQQVMGRSAEGTTLMWLERDANGRVVRSASNAALDPDFFYFRPDVRARYAWGGAVGNWHFYHAHPDDKVAQAKYLLRSIDDGARLSQLSNDQVKSFAKFEKLSPSQQSGVVRKLYGGRVPPELVARFLAVMQTAARIRDIKASGGDTSGADAYRSMIDLERRSNPDMSDEGLLERAKRSVDTVGAAMLLENNIIASEARLKDWLAPQVDSGEFRTVSSKGGLKRITIDAEKIRRLQMSAFFELRDGIELLPDAEIRRIQQANPRYADDIRILRGVIETQRQMMLAPDTIPDEEAGSHRMQVADDVLRELARLDAVIDHGGPLRFYRDVGRSAWQHGQQFEDWMQARLVDAIGRTFSGNDARMIPLLNQMREATKVSNERFLGPRWMARLDKANAFVEVLKAYAREGELNAEVAKVAFYQGMSYVPGVGTLMQIQGGMQGVITLASTQIIPGYGQMLIVLQLAKNGVELVGLAVFEPLKDERELLAYQGYLDAGGSGIFATGQTERFNGRVTPVLKMMDSTGSLSLDERRERIYEYFHDDITRTIDKDASFPYTEREWPHEWIKQEQKWLTVRLRQYVLHWWNATGPFDHDDEILAFRARTVGMSEEEFRGRIEARLWRDYWKGRERAMQKDIVEGEAKKSAFLETLAQIAAVDVGLDEKQQSLVADFDRNGEITFADVLDGMPVIDPAIEIISAPGVETLELDAEIYEEEEIETVPLVNLGARVYASTGDHPLPWTISWEVRQGGSSKSFGWGNSSAAGSMENGDASAAGPWPVNVTAIARDAENREFARQTIDLAVEKIEIGRIDNEEEEEEAATGDEDATVAETEPVAPEEDDTGEALDDPLAGVGPTAETAGETANEACAAARERLAETDGTVTEIEGGLAGLEGDVAAARSAADQLEILAQRAEAAAIRADSAARGIAALRDQSGSLRDMLCAADRSGSAAEVSAQLRALLSQADALMDVVAGAATEAREIRAAAASTISLDDLRGRLEGLLDRIENSRGGLDAASAAADQAASAAALAEEQRARATAALAEAVSENAQAVFDTASQAAEAAAQCTAETRGAIDTSRGAIDGARTRATVLGSALDQLEAASNTGVLSRIDAAVAEAEASEAIAESFFESIANRVEGGNECAWNPPREVPADDNDRGGSDDGSGWTRAEGEGWSASEVETVGQEAPPPVYDPAVDGLIAQATDAFNNCDYATAKSLADRIASLAPGHPWLAENYRRILDADRMRRAAARGLQEAEAVLAGSRGSVDDLRRARAAAHRAALAAPPCLVDRIDGLIDQVDNAIGDALVAEQERRQRERRERSGGLASAIGSVLGTIAGVAAATEGIDIPNLPTIPGVTVPTVPTEGTGGTGGGTTPGGGSPTGGATGGTGGGSGSEAMCTAARPCCDATNPFRDPALGDDRPYEYWIWDLGDPTFSSYTAIGLPVDSSASVRAGISQQMRGNGSHPGFRFLWFGPYPSYQAAVAQTRQRCPNPIRKPAWVQQMTPQVR